MDNLLKVLIADDEAVQRELLKIAVPWHENGFVVCGEAKNGVEALEQCRLLLPDIVLMDINMPMLNGLALTQRLREEGCEARIVIVSGHDEFEYAKTAIRLGVEEYVLKPVDEEYLLEVLLKIRESIATQQRYTRHVEEMRRQTETDYASLRTEFLRSIAERTLDSATQVRQLEYFAVPTEAAVAVAVVKLEEISKHIWTSSDLAVCRFGITNIAQECLGEDFTVLFFPDTPGTLCFAALQVPECSTSAQRRVEDYPYARLLHHCETLRKAAAQYLKIQFSIGVGSVVPSIVALADTYEQAQNAKGHTLVLGGGCVICHSQLTDRNAYVTLSSAAHTELALSLKTGNCAAVQEQLETLLHTAFEKKAGLTSLHNMVFCVLSVMTEQLEEYGIDGAFLYYSCRELSHIFDNFKTLDAITVWLMELTERCVTSLESKTRTSAYVENIKAYIRENYASSELRVETIAKAVFLNESYVSAVFAKKTGLSLVEYITFVRLSNAKLLLDTGQYSAATVAERVGYLDTNYFGKCFKKKYGVSPYRYLQMHGAKK